MSNKVIGDYSAANSIDGSTHYLLIQPGSSSTAYNKINRDVFLGVTGQPADIDTVQTFSNKVHDNTNTFTIKDTLFTLEDNSDVTKKAVFELSGITTATTRTYSLPDATTMLVGTAATQTLTNKTLTSPTITGGTISNSTISVDSIAGFSSANIITIAGLGINNGVLSSNNSVVTANITDAAVTPAKLLAGTGTGWSWQSWTPTWTSLTVGNGTLTAKYIQTGKTVFARISFVFGSTSSTNGDLLFTFPVTAVSYTGGAGLPSIGDGDALDVSASTVYTADVTWQTTTTGRMLFEDSSGTYTKQFINSGTAPATWATGDTFTLNFFYEAA